MADLPKDVKELWEKANSLFNKEEWEAAIHAYTELLESVKENESIPAETKAMLYNHRGLAQYNLKIYDSAMIDFDKSVELNPNDAATYLGRGNTYGNTGDYDRAIDEFSKALKLRPDYATAYSNRGSAYNSKGQYDLAIDDLNKSIELSPDNSKAYVHRGIAHSGKGEHDRAITDFSKALELSPDNLEAYNNRGNAHIFKSEYDHAIADYRSAVKIDPKNSAAINNLSQATFLKNSAEQQEKSQQQFQEQVETLQKNYADALKKYESDLLRTDEYEARQKQYDYEVKAIGRSMTVWLYALKTLAACIVGGIAYLVLNEISLWKTLPLITTAGISSSTIIWHIRILKQEKVRLLALREDVYTKKILANFIHVNVNIEPETRNELLLKFFDHHAENGSAKLIIDLEKNTKSDDSAANIIVQQLKEHLSDKKG